MVAHQSQAVSPEQQPRDTSLNNGQVTNTSVAPGKNEHASDENEIKAAKVQAAAAVWAAIIGAVGAGIFGFAVFMATQHYQKDDGRQKALNEYTTSMKELIASTDIDRKAPQRVAALQYAKTLLVMRELDEDGDRKGQALRFLHENCLVTTKEVTQRCVALEQSLDKEPGKIAEEKIDLRGVNLNGIDLKDTWIPHVNLRGAYMRGANLQNADLKGADLRFTDLTDANLAAAKNLTGACYVEKTISPDSKGTVFPPDFKPADHGMVAIPESESDPNSPDFQSCPKV